MIDAVGVWFYSVNTNRYLYLLRNDPKNPGCWGLPGGKVDPGENLQEAIQRECQEEIGMWPEVIKLVPIEKFTSTDDYFSYNTFFCLVGTEFTPVLTTNIMGMLGLNLVCGQNRYTRVCGPQLNLKKF